VNARSDTAIGQHYVDLSGFDGTAEVVTLAKLAAMSGQKRQLLLGLDPFGYGVEREPLRDR